MGENDIVEYGLIRDVHVVDLEGGRKVVVKFVPGEYDKETYTWIEKTHRWEAAALDAVSINGDITMTFDSRDGRRGLSVGRAMNNLPTQATPRSGLSQSTARVIQDSINH